ncbi:hypothetical protein [Streptomyces misionensis]|uniref:hypothetical protein n=1 Tax=Streptomyces misionensis TaxID=67331 RepID=UPI00396BEC4C
MDQNTPTTQQPTTDNRLLAEQILGTDIDHAWTGDWHQTLRETAARWATTPNHDLAA